MAYRNIRTPVLVFADLHPDLQVTQDDLPVRARASDRFIAKVRCQGRSRGDSGVAKTLPIPKEGGYRCRKPVHDWGLCRVHYRHATNSVRQRALALHLAEVEQGGQET